MSIVYLFSVLITLSKAQTVKIGVWGKHNNHCADLILVAPDEISI